MDLYDSKMRKRIPKYISIFQILSFLRTKNQDNYLLNIIQMCQN